MAAAFRWIIGPWRTIGLVALTTVLIYLTTVIGVRMTGRRTLAEMSAFDFIVAVALGAIVGRTATTRSPSYAQGVAAGRSCSRPTASSPCSNGRSQTSRRIPDLTSDPARAGQAGPLGSDGVGRVSR